MEVTQKFKIEYLEDAISFLKSLPEKVQDKIVYNICKCMYTVDHELFKKLENTNIWEFRTLFLGNSYRLFAFWDKNEETLVVATHGIKKKTQKTPRKEILKAEEMRKKYFENKTRK